MWLTSAVENTTFISIKKMRSEPKNIAHSKNIYFHNATKFEWIYNEKIYKFNAMRSCLLF